MLCGVKYIIPQINDGAEFDTDDKEAFKAEVEKGLRAAIGHNRPKAGGIAADQLKSIISRVERLEEEKSGIAADIRDVFAEAKGNGYDTKALRTIIKMRKKDAAEREEEETILQTYMVALGMQYEMFEGSHENHK